MRQLRISSRLAALLATMAIAAIGCDGDGIDTNPFSATAPFAFAFDAAGKTKVTVDGINGTITVTGSASATQITVDGERRVDADTQEEADMWLDSLEVSVTESADQVTAVTLQPSDSRGMNFVVDYEITIPDDLEVVIANLNGLITVTAVGAPVDVDNVNGLVTLIDIAGPVSVDLVNGNVTAAVTLPPGGLIDITTVNGNIELTIPTSTSAELSAQVGNGGISVLNLTLENQVTTATSVTGRLGAGAGDIDLSTDNGDITVIGS